MGGKTAGPPLPCPSHISASFQVVPRPQLPLGTCHRLSPLSPLRPQQRQRLPALPGLGDSPLLFTLLTLPLLRQAISS